MDTLPPEIIYIICCSLARRDLLHCTRVSKAWCDYLTPLLWRNFIVHSPRQLKALETKEFSTAVLRHGQYIQHLSIASYTHLKPFLQEPPTTTKEAAQVASCVQNLRVFELMIRWKKPQKPQQTNIDPFDYPSASPTPVFTSRDNVHIDDPPLVLHLLKNNPHLIKVQFGGFHFEQEWLLKRGRVPISGDSGPSSSIPSSPPSSLAQLVPSLKILILHVSVICGYSAFRYQVELLTRFLQQIPETVETFHLGSHLEDLTERRRVPSITSTPSPVLVDPTPPNITLVKAAENYEEAIFPTTPLAVEKLYLRFHTLPVGNPLCGSFLRCLGSFMHRCVRLKGLSIDIGNDRHRDATVRYIVNYLEKLRPRLLVILWVEVALEDATLAKLLNCVRLAGCIDSDGDSMDVVQSRGGGQHYKQEQQEQHQYGWRRLKLHGSSPLGPLSSAALIAQCPTLKSLEVVKCYSCPSQVLANILTTSPGLEILTTIEDFKNGEDDYEYTYNHVDARQLLEMTRTTNAGAGGAAWACKELKTLKLVISNIPRPDCKRTQYRARVSATKNGTKGLTGDIEEQALRMQRVICGQLGRLTKLEVLWLGRETRDFRNLDNYRVVPESRREELGLRKRDPNRGDDDKIEKDNEVEEVEDGEAEEAEDEDVEEEEEEEEEVEEAMDYEDDLDHDIEDEYDSDADTDKHGKPLMYPLMFLNPRFQFSCLPLSLASGLDLMSGLKELRELNVEEMAHLIGVEEVRWMVEHWPKLSRVIGLAVKGEVNDAVEWLKQARPWIELPESCNSMRQSTWEYYYPPKRSY